MKYIWAICFLTFLFAAPFLTNAAVVINEVAWMGTAADPNGSYCEWIELANTGTESVNLDGWTLSIGATERILSEENEAALSIALYGFYLIERLTPNACPDPVPEVSADWRVSFGSGIPNSGAIIILFDSNGAEIDRVDGSNDWAIGGSNETKETLQRAISGWTTAPATPRAQNAGSDAGASPPAPTSEQQPVSATPAASGSSLTGASSYVEQTIRVSAGEDRAAIVGAQMQFTGTATGIAGGALTNADFFWTFGDGAFARGKTVAHTYSFPGQYAVFLSVNAGGYSATDSLVVRAEPNQLSISELRPGPDSWLELWNNSDKTLELSGWGIALRGDNFTQGRIFLFPSSTRVLMRTALVVPSSALGFTFPYVEGTVELMYPGGRVADQFFYKGVLANAQQSFQRKNGLIVVADATPGAAETKDSAIVQTRPIVSVYPATPPLADLGHRSNDLQKENAAEQRRDPQDVPMDDAANQVAGVALDAEPAVPQRAKTSRWFLWLSLSAGIGIIAALGVVIARRGEKSETLPKDDTVDF